MHNEAISFFLTYPQDLGALQESQASLPNTRRRYLARSRPRSPSSRSLFSFLSLVFSLAPPSLEARRAENRRGTAFKSAGRLSRDVLGGGAARTNR